MTHFMKYGLMSACLIVQALPAASQVDVDHNGNGRNIDLYSHDSSATVTSRGDGGSLDVVLDHSDDMRIYHLGGKSRAQVGSYGSADTDVFIGHCPPGMHPEPIDLVGVVGDSVIVGCQ